MSNAWRWGRRVGVAVAVGGAAWWFADPAQGPAHRAAVRARLAGLADPAKEYETVGTSSYELKEHAPIAADEASWAAPLTPPDAVVATDDEPTIDLRDPVPGEPGRGQG